MNNNHLIPVLLESPFGSKEQDPKKYQEEIKRNIFYARLCMRDCFMRHEAPFASHLLYTQENVLHDQIKEEKTLGMQAGFVWGMFANYSVFYIDLGMSDGMIEGKKRAMQENRIQTKRNLPEELRKIFNEKFPNHKI